MINFINSCPLSAAPYYTIAFYTHLVPLALSAVIVCIMLLKNNTHQTRAFAWFVGLFCIWLAGDLVLWTVPHYTTIFAIWSVLDFINILFCVAAVYFFYTVSSLEKHHERMVVWGLISLLVVPLVITITGNSVTYLNYTYCEVESGVFITYYKLAVEIITIGWILISAIYAWFKKNDHRGQIALVAAAIVVFIGVFSGTDYVSSITGIYEIGLYGLFILPLSLVLIVSVIVRSGVFKLQTYGIHVGVYSFLVFVASQFFFVKDPVGQVLNIITFILAVIIASIVTRQVGKEHAHQTQVEELNQKLTKANTALADLNQQKNEFLSLATHQLRSPLTSIKWGLEALEDEGIANLTDMQKKTFVHTKTTANDLIRVVGDLLDTSKIEQGKLAVNAAPVDMVKLVKKVVDEFTVAAQHKNLSLSFEPRIITNPLMYQGDETKLQQVFINIIDNAIKYTPNGSVRVVISEDEKNIFIAVTDTGAGIPAEEIATLFTKFTRGSAGKSASGGSGLGLYLAKQVIEMHGGNITITSPGVGLGSTFTIMLIKN